MTRDDGSKRRRDDARDRPHAQRLVLGGIALALPLAGLLLLLARPELDLTWQHHPAHFWLVLAAGALNAALAYGTGVAAARRGDARVFVVSLTFLAAAAFLGLHALATPGVLLDAPNPGFALATPVGLVLGAVFAAASGVDFPTDDPGRSLRRLRAVRSGLLAAIVLWAVVSLAELPPLDGPDVPERASGRLLVLAVPGIALYAGAALRYLQLWRRRRAPMLLGMAAAFVLLAEAMVAVAVARNWQASWWEWHVLMLMAFTLVAWHAHRQWHEERFSDLYLDDTVGGHREMTVLFADLQGFTAYTERHDAADVRAMLNAYFEVAVPPIVRRHGGDIDRIIGDALMVTFNKRGDQPDHAQRAARAALELQRETGRVADAHPGWPRFRVGLNTGDALVSVLGTAGGRTHTVIGDTVNVAARLEAAGPVGGVVAGTETVRRLDGAATVALGTIAVKGREEPLALHQILGMDDSHPR